MDRVAVFIDYQNVYRRGRAAFNEGRLHHTCGQVNPKAVAMEVCGQIRSLTEVRIYRGMPDAHKDSKGHAACQRQLAWWGKLSQVTPLSRPLQYPRDYPAFGPREKGIDVQLAVDFVMMAQRDEYDVGIVFSADTDLIPAIEAVRQLKGGHAVEVAAWQPQRPRYPQRISVKWVLHCHFLDEQWA